MKLKDKVIIITGGGHGICKSAAVTLAANGAKVAVVAKTEDEVKSTVDEIIKKTTMFSP